MGYSEHDFKGLYHTSLRRIARRIRARGAEAAKCRLNAVLSQEISYSSYVLKESDQNTTDGANMHDTFCVSFAGFLRVGELTYEAVDSLGDNFDEMAYYSKIQLLFSESQMFEPIICAFRAHSALHRRG